MKRPPPIKPPNPRMNQVSIKGDGMGLLYVMFGCVVAVLPSAYALSLLWWPQ